jgi:hypothetical protein
VKRRKDWRDAKSAKDVDLPKCSTCAEKNGLTEVGCINWELWAPPAGLQIGVCGNPALLVVGPLSMSRVTTPVVCAFRD